MKLTVLGNNGPFAAPGGVCSSYLVEDCGRHVLLDCGPGSLARLEMICPIERLDAVVLSHLHYDHISDLFSGAYNIQQQLGAGLMQGPLPLLLPDEPAPVRALLASGAFRLVSIDAVRRAGTPFRVGDMALEFMPARHPVEGFAIKISAHGRVMVYTGDTNICAGLAQFCAGADLLLCDACLTADQWSEGAPHLSAALAGKLAYEAGARALLGTHIHPRTDTERMLLEMRSRYPAAQITYPWQSVVI